jgi:hypothetical protein
MSSKKSPAGRVLEFFQTAPLGEAELVHALVRDVMRKRRAGIENAALVKRAVKRVRRAKGAPTSPATSFPPQTSAAD